MQFIRTNNLKPGMRLAKPIYNKMGVLLYDRNSKLTIPAINSIENFGLIGIYILEPAEPLPPLSKEDLAFEQNQTIYMFKLRDCIDKIRKGRNPEEFPALVSDIVHKYGTLDHQINFIQNLRSADDFIYKHSISTAMLTAMLSKAMHFSVKEQSAMVSAALLYDIGYLYVPKTILEKGNQLEQGDRDTIQLSLERGFNELRVSLIQSKLDPKSMALIEYYIFSNSTTRQIPKADPSVVSMTDLIRVADEYDQLTAMNLNHTPVSEIIAMRTLADNPEKFSREVLDALADSIHIVPAGASVDLSTGDKGIVLVENPNDFLKPLILHIGDNQLYDLSNPAIYRHTQIVDIMKTMDNRIVINEETLKLFVADDRIKETAKRFKQVKKRSEKATPKVTSVSISTDNAFSAPIELESTPPMEPLVGTYGRPTVPPKKKPEKKTQRRKLV